MDKTRILKKAKGLYVELNNNRSILPHEEQVQLAKKGMLLLWPRIRELETDLDIFRNLHTMFQVIQYEAGRHLVDITRLTPSESKKKKSNNIGFLLEAIKRLSPKQIKSLIKQVEDGERGNGENT